MARRSKCERCGAVGCWNHIETQFHNYMGEFRLKHLDGSKVNLCKSCIEQWFLEFAKNAPHANREILKDRQWQ